MLAWAVEPAQVCGGVLIFLQTPLLFLQTPLLFSKPPCFSPTPPPLFSPNPRTFLQPPLSSPTHPDPSPCHEEQVVMTTAPRHPSPCVFLVCMRSSCHNQVLCPPVPFLSTAGGTGPTEECCTSSSVGRGTDFLGTGTHIGTVTEVAAV